MNTIKAWLSTKTGHLVVHLAVIGVGAAFAVLEGSHTLTASVLKAAGLAALTAVLHVLLPVIEGSEKTAGSVATTVYDRLKMLPEAGIRRGGALASLFDARDYVAKLPKTFPAAVNNAAGMVFGMLLNDRIGDCYPAALLHALQVLTGGVFDPTDAMALYIYEQVTGYNPAAPDVNGSNPTDQGTAGRPLLAWAKAHGLIAEYLTVPLDAKSLKAAISAYKVVLCEWALPAGAETEGWTWRMPKTGTAAGSWGGHATAEAGYTAKLFQNITWGENGTVTPPFEGAYLVAARVIKIPAVIPDFMPAAA